MYQRAIFLITLFLLVGCAQVDTKQQIGIIQPTDTPTSVSTDTPTAKPTFTPTFTPTPTLTPSITPTPTEEPPLLPQGAVTVEEAGSVWVAYDAQNEEVAVWLPDPDTQEQEWSLRYVKNQNGEVVGWDADDSEWNKVPQPGGAVDGRIDIEESGKYPVWKVNYDSIRIGEESEIDIIVGEFENGEWGVVPFEMTVPDEVISNIRTYYYEHHRAQIDFIRNGGTMNLLYSDVILLGIKLDEDEGGEKELSALVGSGDGITKSQVDIFTTDPPPNLMQVDELQLAEYTQLIKMFKSTSDEVVQGNQNDSPNFHLAIVSLLEGLSVEEGCTLEIGYVNDFFQVCTKLGGESEILRSSSEYELNTILSALWKRPSRNTQGVDWWEEALEIPSGYIGWAGFTHH